MSTVQSTRFVSILAVAAALATAVGCGSPAQPTETTAADEANTGTADTTGSGPATSGGELAQCDVGAVYFNYDSSELDVQARNTLESNVRCLQARTGAANVVGMTDPRGTEEYNLALGDRRARTVTQYMTNMGLEEGRMNVRSVGEEFARGEDESSWATDRRAEIQVH